MIYIILLAVHLFICLFVYLGIEFHILKFNEHCLKQNLFL